LGGEGGSRGHKGGGGGEMTQTLYACMNKIKNFKKKKINKINLKKNQSPNTQNVHVRGYIFLSSALFH
jgi:hypothetical protein